MIPNTNRICSFAISLVWLIVHASCGLDKSIVHKPAKHPLSSAVAVNSSLPASAEATGTRLLYGFSNIPWKDNSCFMDTILQIIAAWCPEDVQEGSPLKTMIEKINNGYNMVTAEDVREFKQGLSGDAKEMVKKGIEGGSSWKFFTDLCKRLYNGQSLLLLDKYKLVYKEYNVAKDVAKDIIIKKSWYRDRSIANVQHFTVSPGHKELPKDAVTIEQMIDKSLFQEITSSMAGPFVYEVKKEHGSKRLKFFREMEIDRWPTKLFICMNRFSNRKRVGGEIQDPSTICIDSSGEGKIIYNLKAFAVEDYSSEPFHVTACVKRGGQWYEVNDLHYGGPAGGIYLLHNQEILAKVQDADLLFYERA